MSNTLQSVSHILRATVSLVMLGLIGTGGWYVYREYGQRVELDRRLRETTAQLEAKAAEVERLAKENARLDLALRLLKVDHRVARIDVLDQQPGDPHPKTRCEFVELNSEGEPIGAPKTFTIDGDVVYVDAWVIKYDDRAVESGDPLGATSVCLFRRVFGEHQQPSEGFPLDASGSRPAIYGRGGAMSPVERDIWAHFWDYANNPGQLSAAGARAAHGEAPSIRLRMGQRYRIELRASGGLSIVPEAAPAKPAI